RLRGRRQDGPPSSPCPATRADAALRRRGMRHDRQRGAGGRRAGGGRGVHVARRAAAGSAAESRPRVHARGDSLPARSSGAARRRARLRREAVRRDAANGAFGRLAVSLRARPVASTLSVFASGGMLTADFIRTSVVGAANAGTAPLEKAANPLVEGWQTAARGTAGVMRRILQGGDYPG